MNLSAYGFGQPVDLAAWRLDPECKWNAGSMGLELRGNCAYKGAKGPRLTEWLAEQCEKGRMVYMTPPHLKHGQPGDQTVVTLLSTTEPIPAGLELSSYIEAFQPVACPGQQPPPMTQPPPPPSTDDEDDAGLDPTLVAGVVAGVALVGVVGWYAWRGASR